MSSKLNSNIRPNSNLSPNKRIFCQASSFPRFELMECAAELIESKWELAIAGGSSVVYEYLFEVFVRFSCLSVLRPLTLAYSTTNSVVLALSEAYSRLLYFSAFFDSCEGGLDSNYTTTQACLEFMVSEIFWRWRCLGCLLSYFFAFLYVVRSSGSVQVLAESIPFSDE